MSIEGRDSTYMTNLDVLHIRHKKDNKRDKAVFVEFYECEFIVFVE